MNKAFFIAVLLLPYFSTAVFLAAVFSHRCIFSSLGLNPPNAPPHLRIGLGTGQHHRIEDHQNHTSAR
jgi:hypothetical protein